MGDGDRDTKPPKLLVFEINNKTYLFLHVLIVIGRKTKSSVYQFRLTFLYSSENIVM